MNTQMGSALPSEKCWGQGRQCGSASNIRDEEEPAYEKEQDTHTERERDRHKEMLYSNRNSYK